MAIQGLIVAINEYDRAPSNANLRKVTDLLRGSATMMQFAGNFAPEAYGAVRDSMAHLDADFSGIFSADHRLMIRKLVMLKKAVGGNPIEYRDLKDAMEVAYRAHAYVCRRLVGEQGSLANESSVAWRTILEKFLPRALTKMGFSVNKRIIE